MIDLLIGFILGGALVLLSVLVGARLSGGGKVPEAPESQGEERPDAEDEARSREIAEGIQNLLTYGKDLEDRL